MCIRDRLPQEERKQRKVKIGTPAIEDRFEDDAPTTMKSSGFKMKGSAYKLGKVATKSAFKQVEDKKDAYARIIKENNMTKVDGYWSDKEGRSPRQYYDAEQGAGMGKLPGNQRRRKVKIDASGNRIAI